MKTLIAAFCFLFLVGVAGAQDAPLESDLKELVHGRGRRRPRLSLT
jgi:hypothetical protein